MKYKHFKQALLFKVGSSIEDCKLIKKAIILLENKKDKNNEDTIQVLNKVQDRLKSILNFV